MKLHEFSDLLPSYGNLFTADEYQEIIQMMATSKFQPKLFKKSRQIMVLGPSFLEEITVAQPVVKPKRAKRLRILSD